MHYEWSALIQSYISHNSILSVYMSLEHAKNSKTIFRSFLDPYSGPVWNQTFFKSPYHIKRNLNIL